jgi:hypothetical protein
VFHQRPGRATPKTGRASSGELYAAAAEFCGELIAPNGEIFETMLH